MKQSSNFAREKMEMWGTSSLFRLAFFSALIVVGVVLSMSCNHGNSGKKPKTPETPNTPNLADLQISQFTIKDKDAKSGHVVFKGKSITIDKKEIKLTFKEADAPKDFKCSQELPVTVQAGKEMTLTFSTVATSKYKVYNIRVLGCSYSNCTWKTNG